MVAIHNKPKRRASHYTSCCSVAKEEWESRRTLALRGVRRFNRVVLFQTCKHKGVIGTPDRKLCWHCVEVQRKYGSGLANGGL